MGMRRRALLLLPDQHGHLVPVQREDVYVLGVPPRDLPHEVRMSVMFVFVFVFAWEGGGRKG